MISSTQKHRISGGIIKSLKEEVLLIGGRQEDLRNLGDDATIRRRVASLLVYRPTSLHRITVNYSIPVKELGNQDWLDWPNTQPCIIPNTNEQIDLTVALIQFPEMSNSEEILMIIDEIGYRPGIAHELFSLVAQSASVLPPRLVALGTRFQAPSVGNLAVACFNAESEKDFYWDWLHRSWDNSWSFICIKRARQ